MAFYSCSLNCYVKSVEIDSALLTLIEYGTT